MSVNKVILVGRLGQNPEVRNTPSGQAVANFSIATNDSWTDKQGQKQERTEWHRLVVWGKLAELCGQYLTKGRQIYVEGRLQTREWTDKDGVKKYTTEVQAQTIQFLGGQGADRGAPMDQESGQSSGMGGGNRSYGSGGNRTATAGSFGGGSDMANEGGGMPARGGGAEPSFTEDDIPF